MTSNKPYCVIRPYGAGYENHITIVGHATNGHVMVRCFNISVHTELEIPHTVFTWTIDNPDSKTVAATGATAEKAVEALVEVAKQWMRILDQFESERVAARLKRAGLQIVGAGGPERIVPIEPELWTPRAGRIN